eukprot:6318901-Amphidinium_carterae.1
MWFYTVNQAFGDYGDILRIDVAEARAEKTHCIQEGHCQFEPVYCGSALGNYQGGFQKEPASRRTNHGWGDLPVALRRSLALQ